MVGAPLPRALLPPLQTLSGLGRAFSGWGVFLSSALALALLNRKSEETRFKVSFNGFRAFLRLGTALIDPR